MEKHNPAYDVNKQGLINVNEWKKLGVLFVEISHREGNDMAGDRDLGIQKSYIVCSGEIHKQAPWMMVTNESGRLFSCSSQVN